MKLNEKLEVQYPISSAWAQNSDSLKFVVIAMAEATAILKDGPGKWKDTSYILKVE
jgi:hypothetical protein